MENRDFRHLVVWQRARRLAVELFQATAAPAFSRDRNLRDQLRRSAISVPSNIAEGNERGSDKDCLRFLYFARGSLAELATQVDIACAVGLFSVQQADPWLAECRALSRMVAGLIRYRSPS